VKFLIDAQLPPALCELLRKMKCEAQHVEDVGLRDASDVEIRNYALKQGTALVTKDRDFVPVAASSAKLQVIWVRTGNIPNRVLFERLEAGWTDVMTHLSSGAMIVEIR
jgi:predicted nuclease of predicted toxin-antitoxin system